MFTDNFDEISWGSTYNADDLKPDLLTHELNKMFTYDETKEHSIYDKSFEGKVKLEFQSFSSEASAKETLKKVNIHIC